MLVYLWFSLKYTKKGTSGNITNFILNFRLNVAYSRVKASTILVYYLFNQKLHHVEVV